MDVVEVTNDVGWDGGASNATWDIGIVGLFDDDGTVWIDAGDDADVAIPAG